MADLAPGDSWGSFRIERLVGRGPAGTVYRASPSAGGKPVTLKLFHESLGETVLARFEDDTRRIVGLNHPNILRVESVGREGGRRFVVTEAFDGRSLRDLGPQPVREACRIFLQAARALGAAWMRLILHRNLKPENVLVSESGDVKVADFGLALEPTPYWSPERRTGQTADMRGELYSLGILFREFVPERHPDVDALLHQMTRTETFERVQMVEDVVSRLEAILSKFAAPPPPPPVPAPLPPPPPPELVVPPMPAMPPAEAPELKDARESMVDALAAEAERRTLRAPTPVPVPRTVRPPDPAPPPPPEPKPVRRPSVLLPVMGTMLVFGVVSALVVTRFLSKLERERAVQSEIRQKSRPKAPETKRTDPPSKPPPVNSRVQEDWTQTKAAIRALEEEMRYPDAGDLCDRFIQRHGAQAPEESRAALTELRSWATLVRRAESYRKQTQGGRALDLLQQGGAAREKDRDRVLARWCEEDWTETTRTVDQALARSDPYGARDLLNRFLKLPHQGGVHKKEADARQLGLLADLEFEDVAAKTDDLARNNRSADAIAAWEAFLAQSHKGGARREDAEMRMVKLREVMRVTLYAGRGAVNKLAVSPDGKRVAFTSDRIRILDVESRAEVWSQPSGSVIRAMSFAGDALVATAHPYRISFWDPEKKAEARGLKVADGSIMAMAITRDGKRLVAARSDGSLLFWDGEAETPSKVERNAAPGVTVMVLSPDGAKAAMAGRDKTIRVRDLATGEEKKWTAAVAGVAALAWSPDGARLASVGLDNVTLWDAAKGEELHSFQGHKGAVACVAFTADGTRVASGGADKLIRLWNPKDGSSAGTLAGHLDRVTGLVALPNGGLLSGGADGAVRIWSLAE